MVHSCQVKSIDSIASQTQAELNQIFGKYSW